MSRRTREINRITTAIITISIKLMVLALLVLLLYEAVVRGFAFGHEIFYAEAAEAAPGRNITFVVKDKETVEKVAGELKKKGLIKNEFAFQFQSRFYDYGNIYPGTYELNTSMTSKEILQELNTEPEDREGNEETSVQTGKASQAKDDSSSAAAGTESSQNQKAGANNQSKRAGSGETESFDSEKKGDKTDSSSEAYQEDEEYGGWIEDAEE